MPPQSTATERLNSITSSLNVTADTLKVLADAAKTPFLEVISNTTGSLLQCVKTIKQNKSDCAQLMEQTHELLNTIVMVHVNSPTGGELPASMLKQIGKFTETLHKIYTFIEVQQSGSKIKNFFRQGEMTALLKDCEAGLQQGRELFQVQAVNIMKDVEEMEKEAKLRHQDVLDMIEGLSDTTSSDGASSINRGYLGSLKSSNSISMLPPEPQMLHGRELELAHILRLFNQGTTRIAILGAGGMGKTSLARAIVHHEEIATRYEQHRFFIACDSTATKVELAAAIGSHVGIKPGIDLTQPLVQHFSSNPPSLLILDNLETLWEPSETRADIEEFLSLLTDVDHLALLITLRGAERPGKVCWTRPFLLPLRPLDHQAARQTFIDIADDRHDAEDVEKVLALTNNMPLAINLLANLVDSEGCAYVLSQWEDEKTALVSDGHDKGSNLDLSISLSLSSPRLRSIPHSHDLLSLMAILPDGLSDVELSQSQIPINNILGCKVALIRTALAYSDEHSRLKVLVPIREYMQKVQRPEDHLTRPLLKNYKELLELYKRYRGSGTVPRILSNFANIQNVLRNGLRQGHPDLKDTVHCTCGLNSFSRSLGRGSIPLFGQLSNILLQLRDHHMEVYFLSELFFSWRYCTISNPEALVSRALQIFEQLDRVDLQCTLYLAIADYYRACKRDFSKAFNFSQTVVHLATSAGDNKQHAHALYSLAWIKWYIGDYSAAQAHAYEARRLATISGSLFRQAMALNLEVMCCNIFGHYKDSLSLSTKAREILVRCGMSGGDLDHYLLCSQADVHRLKSEYMEAHDIQLQILQECPVDQDPFIHAETLLSLAEIGLSISSPKNEVQRNIDTARTIFNTKGRVVEVTRCDATFADLNLREGETLAAKTLFQQCIKLAIGTSDVEVVSHCLEQLGDVSRWTAPELMSNWTIVFLGHCMKLKGKRTLSKALQLLGDVFLAQNDDNTAKNLFTVALEGFTQMDIHQSRAECLLRMGDISKGRGDLTAAARLWEAARPLFERSSQVKQVNKIDERLAVVIEEMRLEQNKKSLAQLTKLNVPAGVLFDIASAEVNFDAKELALFDI